MGLRPYTTRDDMLCWGGVWWGGSANSHALYLLYLCYTGVIPGAATQPRHRHLTEMCSHQL